MSGYRSIKIDIPVLAGVSSFNIKNIILAESELGPQAAVGGDAIPISSVSTAIIAQLIFDPSYEIINSFGSYSSEGIPWAEVPSLIYTMPNGSSIDLYEVSILLGTRIPFTYPRVIAVYGSNNLTSWDVVGLWVVDSWNDDDQRVSFRLQDSITLSAQSFQQLNFNKLTLSSGPNYPQNQSQKVGFNAQSMLGGRSVLRRMNPFTGDCFIAGSTTSLGFPIPRQADLYHQETGSLVARVQTSSDGYFIFDRIKKDRYQVVGVDRTGEQNSVIYANVESVKMS